MVVQTGLQAPTPDTLSQDTSHLLVEIASLRALVLSVIERAEPPTCGVDKSPIQQNVIDEIWDKVNRASEEVRQIRDMVQLSIVNKLGDS